MFLFKTVKVEYCQLILPLQNTENKECTSVGEGFRFIEESLVFNAYLRYFSLSETGAKCPVCTVLEQLI